MVYMITWYNNMLLTYGLDEVQQFVDMESADLIHIMLSLFYHYYSYYCYYYFLFFSYHWLVQGIPLWILSPWMNHLSWIWHTLCQTVPPQCKECHSSHKSLFLPQLRSDLQGHQLFHHKTVPCPCQHMVGLLDERHWMQVWLAEKSIMI